MVVHDAHLEGILSLKDLLNFISLKVELEEDDRTIPPIGGARRAEPNR